MTCLRSYSKSASEVGTQPQSADSVAHAPETRHTPPSPAVRVPGQLLGVGRDGGKHSAHLERQHSLGSALETPGWEQHPLFPSSAPFPRSSVHMAEGLSWDLLCLRLKSSLPWHEVGWGG